MATSDDTCSAERQPTPVPLSVGAHLDASEGTCLMELVSVVAAEPWSDRPSCTHPLVAHLARLVNDALSDGARQELRGLVPSLVGAASEDPSAYASVAHACTEHALRVGTSPLLVHFHRVAQRQLAAPGGPSGAPVVRPGPLRRSRVLRMPPRVFRRGPALRAVEAAVDVCARAEGAARDAALTTLLSRGLAAVGETASLATTPTPATGEDGQVTPTDRTAMSTHVGR